MRSNSLVQSVIVGIVIGLIGVALVYWIADGVSGPLRANGPDGELADVPLGGGLLFTAIGGLVGAGIAYGVRNMNRSVDIFALVCLLALVAYGIWAIVAADGMATGLWLNVMHLAAASPIIGMLTRWLEDHAFNRNEMLQAA